MSNVKTATRDSAKKVVDDGVVLLGLGAKEGVVDAGRPFMPT